MKTFFKTVLMIIVIILTTWTVNAETNDDASYVKDIINVAPVDRKTGCISSAEFEKYADPITYIGGNNINNTNIIGNNPNAAVKKEDENYYYYNGWFDKNEKWSAHTTFFFKNIYIKLPNNEVVSLDDHRIEDIIFYVTWYSHSIGEPKNTYKIGIRAKWVDKDKISAWSQIAKNNKNKRNIINDIVFAKDVADKSDSIIIDDINANPISYTNAIDETSNGFMVNNGKKVTHTCYMNGDSYAERTYKVYEHPVNVQIPTDYSKNDVLCLSFGGGAAGGYIDINYISLIVSFTYNPNKTDNNAKSTAINEVRNTVTDNAYYDFTGRKIAYPQSGHTYIHNGKLIRFKKEE